MAIVGTAYVRLRIIGDKLKKDIGESVTKAVDASTADLDKVGETIGQKISDSTTKEVERSLGSQMGRISDDIGDAIGRRMADNMGRSLRSRLPQPFKDGFAKLKPLVNRAGSQLGEAFGSFKSKIEKQFSGKGKGGGLGGIIMSGLGVLITVLPSVLAGAGAVIGAYAATAVTAVAMIGPAAAGAGIAAVAAFSAIKISAGLVGLAMKYPSDALEDFQKRAETFKGLIATPIQDGLLSGLNASMRLLSPVIAALEPQLRGLGTVVGDIAIGFADAVRQGEMMDRIGRILETNNQFVKDAGGGVSQLGQAFIVLLDHLRPVTAEIGEMVGQFGSWALNAINAASASGELDSWINRMWASFKRLMGIVVDFGVGIYNVFSAAQPAAGNMMNSLEGIARRFREWTGDEANQQRMVIFFEKMREIVAQVNDILGDLVGGALKGLEGTDVSSLSAGLETLRSLGAPLAQMFRDIQDAAGPQLLSAFQSFADIISELANNGVLGILAGAFANLLDIIAQVLSIPGVGTILGFVAGLAVLGKTVMLIVSVLGFLWRGLQPVILILRLLGIGIGILVGAFGAATVAIAAAVAAVVGGLIYFFGFTETGRAIIGAVWEWIKNAIATAIDGIVAAFHWVVSALQTAWTFIQTAATGIWNAISTAFNAVLGVVQTVFTAIWNVISTILTAIWTVVSTIFNAVWSVISTVLQTIWDFIVMVFDAIKTVIDVAMNIVMEIWSRIWPLLMLPIRIFYGLVILLWEGIVAGISWALDKIFSVVSTVWNAVSSFITGVLNAIWSFIKMVWDGIVTAVTWALDRLWTGIKNIWNAIWGFLQPIVQGIWDFIKNAWESIYNAVAGFLFSIYATVMGKFYEIRALIQAVMDVIKDKISSAWDTITGAIRGAMDAVWGIIQSVWDKVVGFVQGALDRIKGIITNIWGGLQSMGDGIVAGLKGAVNAVIRGVNTVIGGINWAIDTANKLPGPDIPNIPKIPLLAKGGVVSPRGGGTLAMIAEAGRPERVEPLDKDGMSKRDRAILNEFRLAAGGGANVNVYLGTRELIELVDVVVEEKQDGLADRVLTGTKG